MGSQNYTGPSAELGVYFLRYLLRSALHREHERLTPSSGLDSSEVKADAIVARAPLRMKPTITYIALCQKVNVR